jgi:hypothetical protein
MAIDTNPQTFTDAELLALTRHAIATILAGGQAYGINGRSLTRADLTDLWETVRTLETRIAAAGGTGSVALVEFGGPA